MSTDEQPKIEDVPQEIQNEEPPKRKRGQRGKNKPKQFEISTEDLVECLDMKKLEDKAKSTQAPKEKKPRSEKQIECAKKLAEAQKAKKEARIKATADAKTAKIPVLIDTVKRPKPKGEAKTKGDTQPEPTLTSVAQDLKKVLTQQVAAKGPSMMNMIRERLNVAYKK